MIRTERLVLRPLEHTDIEDIVAYAKDEEVGALIPFFPHPYTHDHAKEFVQKTKNDREKKERYEWGIEHEGRIIGAIGMTFKQHNVGEVGYAIGKAHWGRGITSEALNAIIQYAFETEKLHRLQALTLTENLPSQRVLQKAGFLLEGRQKESAEHRGKRYDDFLWGLVKSDWKPTSSSR